MKLFFFILLAISSASSLIRVNDRNFKDVVIESRKVTLVDFYADWCRHCMKLMPTIEELADLYADEEDVQIVKINGDVDGKKMTRKFDVPGFPMLLLFNRTAQPIEYKGMRELQSISNFIQQASGIRLGEISRTLFKEPLENFLTKVFEVTDDDFQSKVLRSNQKTIVAFLNADRKESACILQSLSELANKVYAEEQDIIKFAVVDASNENKARVSKTLGQFGVSRYPTILLFDPEGSGHDGLKRPIPVLGDLSLASMITFINERLGLFRTNTGELNSQAGRISAISQLLASQDDSDMNRLTSLKEIIGDKNTLYMKDLLGKDEDVSMLPFYQKLIKRREIDGFGVFGVELRRLETLLSKSATNLEKSSMDYLRKRINILKDIVGG